VALRFVARELLIWGASRGWQDPQGEEDVERPLRRERLMEAVWPEMAYGESGDPAPSLIPYQVTARSELPPSRLR
jgi:hypothetical protein